MSKRRNFARGRVKYGRREKKYLKNIDKTYIIYMLIKSACDTQAYDIKNAPFYFN